MSKLEISNLHVDVETESGPKQILKGVDLTVKSGETHAIMGPNGSGKSTLSYAIAGHPKYEVTSGSITLDGEDVLEMSVDERARAGLFLAMQYPVEVPGVSMSNFLRTAATAVRGEAPKLRHWVKETKEAATATVATSEEESTDQTGSGAASVREVDATVHSSAELLEKFQGKTADAPMCMTCGTKMRPAGSCYVCEGCGSTSGCS